MLYELTIKSALEIVSEIATKELVNGASVNMGLGYMALNARGVFIGDHAQWDAQKHSLDVRYTPSVRVREAIKNTKVTMKGLAASGICINTITDVTSGLVNSVLTPGGGVTLAGNRIKLEGEAPSIGIVLTHQTTNEVTAIPQTAILTNVPSKVLFIVPAGLAAGEYTLSLTTQFSSSGKPRKTPQTYVFDYRVRVNG